MITVAGTIRNFDMFVQVFSPQQSRSVDRHFQRQDLRAYPDAISVALPASTEMAGLPVAETYQQDFIQSI